MLDRLERLGDRAADALRRRVGRDEFREALLEVDELAVERVELAVADLGVVEDVVAVFVIADEGTEFLGLQAGRFEVSCIRRHRSQYTREHPGEPSLAPLETEPLTPTLSPRERGHRESAET